MAGDGDQKGLLAWVQGGSVKIEGVDMATGLQIHSLPSSSPMWTAGVDNPSVLSAALAERGIKHHWYDDGGGGAMSVDTDRKGLWEVIASILGL